MDKKIAVYGSLREGYGNNRLLRDSNKLSSEIVSIPFRMISMGGFPGLIPSEDNNDITIEIWEVDAQTYKNVEILEGFPSFYQKALIPTSLGDLEIYVLEDPRYQSGYEEVESGDWTKFYKRRYVLQN